MENYLKNDPLEKMETDECITKGICAISPSLSFLQEVIKSYLKELAFYLLKLKELGINNEKIKENVLDVISGLIINIDYSEEQFSALTNRLYGDLSQAKDLYFSLCEKNNIKAESISLKNKNPQKKTLSDAIRQGQAIVAGKKENLSIEQKKIFELTYIVIKSICIHLAELKDLGSDEEEAYTALLNLLNIMNSPEVALEELHSTIKNIVELDHEIMQKLQNTREQNYGEIIPAEISLSTRPNKAILVTGTNLKELELLLQATQNKGIDIYTHGQMIMAHSFPKLRAYPHLFGHFGKGTDTHLLDFAAFPGAIFMTKHSFQRVEKLYRSSIFTSDIMAPRGVTIIRNNDFEPLIQAALRAKGFTENKENGTVTIDLHEKSFLQKISEVAEKIEKGEIKHLFIIGRPDYSKTQKEYFEKFLDLLRDDCFVLSFSYTNNSDNVFLVKSEYSFHLINKALKILTNNISISDLKPNILYTRCDTLTISNILQMKLMGADKIYATDCSPHLVNPTIVETVREMYGIKKYTNPKADLEEMLKD